MEVTQLAASCHARGGATLARPQWAGRLAGWLAGLLAGRVVRRSRLVCLATAGDWQASRRLLQTGEADCTPRSAGPTKLTARLREASKTRAQSSHTQNCSPRCSSTERLNPSRANPIQLQNSIQLKQPELAIKLSATQTDQTDQIQNQQRRQQKRQTLGAVQDWIWASKLSLWAPFKRCTSAACGRVSERVWRFVQRA